MIPIITPYIATASQKITLTRFFEVILGCLTEPANKLLPVKKIPLLYFIAYHAAPMIEKPNANAIPRFAQV
jgi:hypothetical protein